MPMPKPVCRTQLYNKVVQLEVCRTFSGRGMGINGTAHIIIIIIIAISYEVKAEPEDTSGAEMGERDVKVWAIVII